MSFQQIMIITSFLVCFGLFMNTPQVNGNQDAKRLYENLFKGYNILVRPVENSSDFLTVKLGLKLIQIVELEWTDNGLKWIPSDYNDLKQLYVTADKLWLPDIVLFNNADDAFEVATKTKVNIFHNGTVVWRSPITLKSNCAIDLKYYPLDEQICTMKFGTWSYGSMINLKHHHFRSARTEPGIDLTDYYLNLEWDIMNVTALERKQFYSNEPYSDLFFSIRLRRKTLFYTFTLLVPCVGLSLCSVFVFYLPTNSREKVSLTISILISLMFLLLVFIDIMPSTSICLPLLGKYLIFILALVISSIVVTCFIVNVHFRSASTHSMSPWLKRLFLVTLPSYLLISLPQSSQPPQQSTKANRSSYRTLFDTFKNAQQTLMNHSQHSKSDQNSDEETSVADTTKPFTSCSLQRSPTRDGYIYPPEINRAIRNCLFIAYHLDNETAFEHCKEDWQTMALVLDRIFFRFFLFVCVCGTAGIFLQAPTLYQSEFPIDVQHSMVGKQNQLESILHTF